GARPARRGQPGPVHRRAVRGPDRAGQRAARRGRPAGYRPAAGRAAVRGLRRHDDRPGRADRQGLRRARRRRRRHSPALGAAGVSRLDPAPPPRFTGLTVRGWFRLVFAAIVVFVLAASVIIALVLARSRTVSSRLNGTIQPAEAQAYLLQLSLLQQQSSVRGYVISREPGFLTPYTEGLATEHRAAAELRQLVGRDQPMAADLTRVEQAAVQWRAQYAVPLINLAKSGAPSGQATILLDGSEEAFSGLRALFDRQNLHLADQVTRGSARLSRVRAVTNWTFIILLIAFLVAAGALAVVLNYAVLQPLNRIRSSARRVVAGD